MDPFKIEFQINNALNAVRHLRSSVSNVFEVNIATILIANMIQDS